MHSDFILKCLYSKCCFADCHYTECCYTECRYAKCNGVTALMCSFKIKNHADDVISRKKKTNLTKMKIRLKFLGNCTKKKFQLFENLRKKKFESFEVKSETTWKFSFYIRLSLLPDSKLQVSKIFFAKILQVAAIG
jgi:hypothetical protein